MRTNGSATRVNMAQAISLSEIIVNYRVIDYQRERKCSCIKYIILLIVSHFCVRIIQ